MSLSVCSGPCQVTLAVFLALENRDAPTRFIQFLPSHVPSLTIFAEILQIFHIPRSKSKSFVKPWNQIFRFSFAMLRSFSLWVASSNCCCTTSVSVEPDMKLASQQTTGSHLLPTPETQNSLHTFLHFVALLPFAATLTLCYAALGYNSSVFKFNCSLNSLYRCSAFSRPPNMVSFRVSFYIIYILQPVRTQWLSVSHFHPFPPISTHFHPFPPISTHFHPRVRMCPYLSCPAAFLRVAPCYPQYQHARMRTIVANQIGEQSKARNFASFASGFL